MVGPFKASPLLLRALPAGSPVPAGAPQRRQRRRLPSHSRQERHCRHLAGKPKVRAALSPNAPRPSLSVGAEPTRAQGWLAGEGRAPPSAMCGSCRRCRCRRRSGLFESISRLSGRARAKAGRRRGGGGGGNIKTHDAFILFYFIIGEGRGGTLGEDPRRCCCCKKR